MALLPPLAHMPTPSQGWGSTHNIYEPMMWGGGGLLQDQAYWVKTSQLIYQYTHFHPGLDLPAAAGTPILACERGTVVLSDYDRVSGYRVRVEIRPGVQYGSGHMLARGLPVGTHVQRGQQIGLIGSSGTATGPHDHFFVEIKDSYGRSIIWNPNVFLPGGRLADDPRIKPLGADPVPPVVIGPVPVFPKQVSFAAGTYVGHRFSATGATIATKPYTLLRSSSAPASTRSLIINNPGYWLYITAGIWAGYWIKEGPGITY